MKYLKNIVKSGGNYYEKIYRAGTGRPAYCKGGRQGDAAELCGYRASAAGIGERGKRNGRPRAGGDGGGGVRPSQLYRQIYFRPGQFGRGFSGGIFQAG